MMASIIKGLKPSKKSVSTYLILLVVVAFTFDKLAIALFQSILAGIIAFVVAFCLWELVRFTLKVTKKVQFLSFGEAVKGAF
ncbi:hypothetical protein PP175_27705 (plasmid) [Aneurinibacillus sp. Ricciae_BoGa-3]|uniref:hypothetical protein n=1 Tax=Aneurinibacillus sp. Ricciae_BoGa-3 TaxID=3022697 RepID=UPI0023413107|nr:hypothetical protein [Aneurinibacillus sp. Ricciae_BoGa-3]WCK56979.1 hypothetical protein PP175_27705 [Aneurinibacillus sp. Ricciae_BoGa-3]